MRIIVCAAVLSTFIAYAPNASAAPITVTFPGVITSKDDPDGKLGPDFQIGALFLFSYTVDPDRVGASSCVDERLCFYEYGPSMDTVQVVFGVGTADLSGLISLIGIANDEPPRPPGAPIDRWFVRSGPTGSPQDIPGELSIGLQFLDDTSQRLDSTDFFVNTDLDGWTETLVFFADEPGFFLGTGTIIPEPTSAALLLIGLGAMGVVVVMRRAARSKVLPLLAALMIPFSSAAMPVEPIVFDFEDGLQGWTLTGSAQRVQTQVLGGEWAIFGDGFIEFTSILAPPTEIEINRVTVDVFVIAGHEEGLAAGLGLDIGDFLFIGLVVPFEVSTPGNPGRREIGIGTGNFLNVIFGDTAVCLTFPTCNTPPVDTRMVALIDNITFHPIPEPGSVALLVLGLVGVALGRRLIVW